MEKRYLPIRISKSPYNLCRLPSKDIKTIWKIKSNILQPKTYKPDSQAVLMASEKYYDIRLIHDEKGSIAGERTTTFFIPPAIKKATIIFIVLTINNANHIVPAIFFPNGQIDVVATYPLDNISRSLLGRFFKSLKTIRDNKVMMIAEQDKIINDSMASTDEIEFNEVARSFDLNLQESDPTIGAGFCVAWSLLLIDSLLQQPDLLKNVNNFDDRLEMYGNIYYEIRDNHGLDHWNKMISSLNTGGKRIRNKTRRRKRSTRRR